MTADRPGVPPGPDTPATGATTPVPDEAADWRGVATEGAEDLSASAGVFLRGRSRRLLRELLGPHRRALWVLFATILVQNLAWLAGPLLIGVGIDVAVPALLDGDAGPLVWTTLAMVAAACLDAALRYRFLIGSGQVGQEVLLTLRRRVLRHVQSLPLAFHERYTSGKTISRLTSDVEALAELLDEGLNGLLTALFSIVGIGLVLLVLDLPLGLVALLGFPALYWLARWFQRNSTIAYRRTRETVAALIVQFTETFGGIRAVQAFRREPRNDALHAALNEENRQSHDQAFWLIAVFIPAVTMIANLVTVAVLGYGALRVMDGDLAVGVLVSFLLYLRRFFDPLQDIAMFYNSYQSANAALEKLSGVLEEASTVPEPVDPLPLPHARGELTFDRVRFGYGETTVLPEFDLVVPAGQTVALVGATGAGKSTLARLIARFYDPDGGQVRLDGVPLDRVTDAELRRAVVMVTQESYLFSGSIADNISFGRPEATRAEIEAAATAIGAHGFITALPEGYDTDVRKRGGRLSAGQRQLVSFARAFLADPAVLVLDEATSSLDVPSERLVQAALQTLLADRTAVIIAHRLSTVEVADRVLVMEAGRLVEDGAPADLVAGRGRFADLHRAWADSLV
ncbi:ATP-binding cassette domain-containing protein [Modestobacter sp. I12A-02628]|uniref:ABC transporter ATP-binding protein n=1 Tax=Goekera deserti TaxID=2497753 RepID=A0A7K3WIT8_9ACTN|nr:ABC transporter ATP-binding protein [Goekera deserti]MPQ99324.1 ATP-binding cassette domain-containing protein [Goekera deserti]NDI50323.1 ATP-binding cassette domain-containing protein [Goekera deserti]NEL56425.1 ABC transporter ATP-binding protein [Goekera deserti]